LAAFIEDPKFIAEFYAGSALFGGLGAAGAALLSESGGLTTLGLGAEGASTSSTEIFVLGLGGTELAYEGQEGYNVLNLPQNEWSLASNDGWVQSGIDGGNRFLLTAQENGATLFSEENGETVFARELNMLNEADYIRVGDLMVPPGW
jgi:hypothetical protein